MNDLPKQSLAAVARLISNGEVSSREVTEQMLTRIRELNPTYHAYSEVFEDEALGNADRADAAQRSGQIIGPIHGVPIAVKDLLDVEGHVTACGSPMRAEAIATNDATAVSRLKGAGGVILGKLNMTEFALSGYHPDMPAPVNPWGADRWSGVSSSGSAVAAATALAFGTLGSDTGGSIRFPAAVNGVVGIKPTFGRVSKWGAYPLAYTLDHIGPIARTVEDAAILFDVISGFDDADPFSRRAPVKSLLSGLRSGLKGLRVGVDETYNATGADPQVSAAVLEASRVLADLGAELVDVDVMDTLTVAPYWGAVVAAESSLIHAKTYPSRASEYGPVFENLLASSSEVTGAVLTEAQLASARVEQTYENAFEQVDLLLCPGAPLPAMPLDEFPPDAVLPPEAVASFVGFTAPMNFSGVPTVSVPCGLSSEGLPIGLQFVGPRNSEDTLVRVAHSYEEATSWRGLLQRTKSF